MTLRGRGTIKGNESLTDSTDDVDGEPLLPIVLADQPAMKAEEKRFATRGTIQRTYRSMRYHWSLMTFTSKLAVGTFFTLIAFHVIIGSIDAMFGSSGIRSQEVSKTDNYAVLINTYRRPQILRDAVLHYADKCGKRSGVSQVFVLWADEETLPPDLTFFFGTDQVASQNKLENRASIQVITSSKDSLNSRFLPIPFLETDAVFMVDDDVKASCGSLSKGFLAWRTFPTSLVGFYPRLASPASSTAVKNVDAMAYHNWPGVFFRQRFNIILTKAAFLHRKYLDLYSSSAHPSEIKEYIDAQMNCEDIAMAMLVANYTRSVEGEPSPPIYVEGIVSDAGLYGGISSGVGHMGKRSDCLTELTRIYEKLDWGAPLAKQMSLDKCSWHHHSPGFWWQYLPSNVFEWFALGHLFS